MSLPFHCRLALMSCVFNKYWDKTFSCENEWHGLSVRIYLVGIIVIICVNLILLVLLMNRSGQGAITDTQSRKLVAPLLTVKILLIIPETLFNIFGTTWAFCGSIKCDLSDFYTKTVIESKSLLVVG